MRSHMTLEAASEEANSAGAERLTSSRPQTGGLGAESSSASPPFVAGTVGPFCVTRFLSALISCTSSGHNQALQRRLLFIWPEKGKYTKKKKKGTGKRRPKAPGCVWHGSNARSSELVAQLVDV